MKTIPALAIFLAAYAVLLGVVVSPASFGVARGAMAAQTTE